VITGFGERIRKYRKLRKLTQEQLGELLGGITKSYISKVESESTVPSLEMLANIAQHLEVEVSDLIDGKKLSSSEINDSEVDWILLGEELEKEGITPEQVKIWAEIAKRSMNKS
jgi:transcriptional regulator with XRE-family HTH domain